MPRSVRGEKIIGSFHLEDVKPRRTPMGVEELIPFEGKASPQEILYRPAKGWIVSVRRHHHSSWCCLYGSQDIQVSTEPITISSSWDSEPSFVLFERD